jgi:hypothetical protein
MARGLDKDALRKDWDGLCHDRPKDWYSIYEWSRTRGISYIEWIAEWIVESFADIQLVTKDLRKEVFKTEDHRGQADILEIEARKDPLPFNEKRFVRAIFNLGELLPLGKIIDYEVPLKATSDAEHGDIDLLCLAPLAILCVEAKNPLECESILKAILQAFVYTSLTAIRHDAFVAEFQLPTTLLLTPAILIGKEASSQLHQSGKYPHLSDLVRMLNADLAISGAGEIRFFVIDNDKAKLKSCLRVDKQLNGDKKVIFANGFTPKVAEENIKSDFVDADLDAAFKLLHIAEAQYRHDRAGAARAIAEAGKAVLDGEKRLPALNDSDRERLQSQLERMQGVIKRFRSQLQ